MSMNDLHRAFRLIDEHSDKTDFIGGRPEELVALAERTLDITFPPTYREFLLQLGAGGFAAEEFYGVINADFVNSCVPDVVWFNLDERKTAQLPKTLIIFYGYGDGCDCAIDTSQQTTNGENPIVHWAGGLSSPDDKLEVVAEDFGQFLYKTIKESLSD